MNDNDRKYNGWTNYETWRVNLEVFDHISAEGADYTIDADWCKDYAEEIVSYDLEESIGKDFALAFLGPVNWEEIAAGINGE